MKYLALILLFLSFNAYAAFSMNVCADKEEINKISHLYSLNVTNIDKTLSSINIIVPDKLGDKYEFTKVYFAVSKYQKIILSGNLQTELKNKQHSANLFIRSGMINSIKIYAYYSDQLDKVLFDTDYCEFELKQT